MELISFTLLLLASFLGILIGIIVSNIAVEEIGIASNYLKYLNVLLIPLIILLASYRLNVAYSMICAGIALVLLVILRHRYDDAWTFAFLGVAAAVSTLTGQAFNVAIMIAIYGMSVATLQASKHFRRKINGQVHSCENISLAHRMLSRYSYYLPVGIITYMVFTYLI